MNEKLIQFALICLCVLPVWLIIRQPWKRPTSREAALCLFMMYLTALFIMALDGAWSTPAAMLASARERLLTRTAIFLKPLSTIRHVLSKFPSDYAYTQLLGNTLLFMPWGFFLPLLWKPFRRLLPITAACLGLTCFIEFTQLFIGRTVDVDDLILNFPSSMCGAGLWWITHRLRKE